MAPVVDDDDDDEEEDIDKDPDADESDHDVAIGAAADGSDDVIEDVLFVRALSRAPQDLTAKGR